MNAMTRLTILLGAALLTASLLHAKEAPMFFSLFGLGGKGDMISPEEALPGRTARMRVPEKHFATGAPMQPALDGLEVVQLGMGCFWGAERKLWKIPGVVTTAVGYSGGYTPNASYEEVCSGRTGHAETVRVVYDPRKVTLDEILRVFWESHDPTQGMRQGNDRGTQYRSAIYVRSKEALKVAEASRDRYQAALTAAGHKGKITTEIRADDPPFYFAEEYHQQYLAKNPDGYCGLGGTGVSCPVGVSVSAGVEK